MSIFTGAGVAIVTPMKENGDVNFEKLGETDPMFKKLAEIVAANNGLWCYEAEKYLLANAKSID